MAGFKDSFIGKIIDSFGNNIDSHQSADGG